MHGDTLCCIVLRWGDFNAALYWDGETLCCIALRWGEFMLHCTEMGILHCCILLRWEDFMLHCIETGIFNAAFSPTFYWHVLLLVVEVRRFCTRREWVRRHGNITSHHSLQNNEKFRYSHKTLTPTCTFPFHFPQNITNTKICLKIFLVNSFCLNTFPNPVLSKTLCYLKMKLMWTNSSVAMCKLLTWMKTSMVVSE